MAGLFAARALRAGRVNFDPFGERSSDEDDVACDDDLEAVEEAPEMTEEEAGWHGGGGASGGAEGTLPKKRRRRSRLPSTRAWILATNRLRPSSRHSRCSTPDGNLHVR